MADRTVTQDQESIRRVVAAGRVRPGGGIGIAGIIRKGQK